MTYDQWKTTPPDDDPDGDAHQQCPGCSARDGERCDLDCTCGACERVDDDGPRGDEAAAHEREQQADIQVTLK